MSIVRGSSLGSLAARWAEPGVLRLPRYPPRCRNRRTRRRGSARRSPPGTAHQAGQQRQAPDPRRALQADPDGECGRTGRMAGRQRVRRRQVPSSPDQRHDSGWAGAASTRAWPADWSQAGDGERDAPRGPRRAARRTTRRCSAAAIANHSLEWSAARVSSGIGVSSSGVGDSATASNTSRSSVPKPGDLSEPRGRRRSGHISIPPTYRWAS